MNAVVAVLLHLAEDEGGCLAEVEDELGGDAIAPLIYPTTLETEYFGGIDRSICT